MLALLPSSFAMASWLSARVLGYGAVWECVCPIQQICRIDNRHQQMLHIFKTLTVFTVFDDSYMEIIYQTLFRHHFMWIPGRVLGETEQCTSAGGCFCSGLLCCHWVLNRCEWVLKSMFCLHHQQMQNSLAPVVTQFSFKKTCIPTVTTYHILSAAVRKYFLPNKTDIHLRMKKLAFPLIEWNPTFEVCVALGYLGC